MKGYREALAALRHLERFGIRLGLENMRSYCARAGHPERAYPSLHVAGTNGKGTTAFCLAALGSAHGLKTGLYTSPHLVDFRERIRVNGRPVDGAAVTSGWEKIAGFVADRCMTYFEATTLIALEHFATERVDLAVLEVGLGGRLDATNVVTPLAAIVTNVGHDHERHLGNDLATIAGEKGGIFKPNVPALVGEPGPPEVRIALADAARSAGTRACFLPDAVAFAVERIGPHETAFDYRSPAFRVADLAIPFAGAHFACDAALALWAWETAGLPLEAARARAALAGTGPPGRCEWRVVDGVRFLFDVAHNPSAVLRLAATLAQIGAGRSAVVAGILADKAWVVMLDALAPVAPCTWFCGLETALPERRLSRAAAMEELADRPTVQWAESVGEGLAAARGAVIAGRAEQVVVTGSFHTVGEALVVLGIAVPEEPYTPSLSVVDPAPAGAIPASADPAPAG